jgi:hypothetical protein
MTNAPIILFAYNRLDTLTCTVESLRKNYLAKESDIFIFSDYGKNSSDIQRVLEVRQYLKNVDGFKSVTLNFSQTNCGLANSVIAGVNEIIKKHRKVIVIEDDLVSSNNFLTFMNQCLSYYESNLNVFSVSGYSVKCVKQNDDDVYFTKRASSWGWATWADRWLEVDWEVKDYSYFEDHLQTRFLFNKMGSDLTDMLRKQMAGKIDSWAIRWAYHQFKKNMYTVYPTISKIENIGTSVSATHTKDRFNRYWTPLDSTDKIQFKLQVDVTLHPHYISTFLRQFSIINRIKYKILNKFF